MISFILRQVTQTGGNFHDLFLNDEIFLSADNQPSALASESHLQHFVPNQAREKWIKKRTSVKIKNGASNHRGNDLILVEGRDQVGSDLSPSILSLITSSVRFSRAGSATDHLTCRSSVARRWG